MLRASSRSNTRSRRRCVTNEPVPQPACVQHSPRRRQPADLAGAHCRSRARRVRNRGELRREPSRPCPGLRGDRSEGRAVGPSGGRSATGSTRSPLLPTTWRWSIPNGERSTSPTSFTRTRTMPPITPGTSNVACPRRRDRRQSGPTELRQPSLGAISVRACISGKAAPVTRPPSSSPMMASMGPEPRWMPR
ncbi:MAG: hypothetical protein JJLCMIEE_00412 [Acidimicrobiales bacterium]|nr:hypothetical protein [Acidimicrobiales bacterium]